uniref:Uncharacterized protein n=1 Tax=viral metagenome TaxID=1070528 RepID=A0A6C0IL68_9ZZZZ
MLTKKSCKSSNIIYIIYLICISYLVKNETQNENQNETILYIYFIIPIQYIQYICH